MEEIKVGEYVRLDRNQGINKIVEIEDDVYYLDTEIVDDWGEITWSIYKNKLDEEIIAHSPNIIDLIEVGDYVNGHKVCRVIINKFSSCYVELEEVGCYVDIPEEIEAKDIKSIVTHEQYNSIKYVIGE